MQIVPIKLRIVKPGDDVVAMILDALREMGRTVKTGDVIAISSKAISMATNKMVRLSDVKPSTEALRLAREHKLDPRIAEVVLQEADEVLGGRKGLLLTLKDGTLMPNAGLDVSNAPPGHVMLLPEDPMGTAHRIRDEVRELTGERIGVIIVDSRVFPLRVGTTGVSIGVAGFEPVVDFRGKEDLYGKRLKVTRQSLADDLGSSAHALMGETDEQIPAVLIRDAPVRLTDERISDKGLYLSKDRCLYLGSLGGS